MEYLHDVFVSFSFKDQVIAEELVNKLLNQYCITHWICTRDIRAGEHYKRTIVKAIADAGLVLMIQSESSMASQEVPKEISIALAKNKTVIPFVIDSSELTGDLEYDLLTVQRIDATVPTMDERIEELARQICMVLGRPFSGASAAPAGKEPAKLLSTASVIPKSIFCGREDVLQQIAEHFANGERVLFLHGIGGIGKTQIAKQYAKRYRKNYDTVVYATYSGGLKELILAEEPFCVEPPVSRYHMSDGSPESDDAFFARKLQLIKRLSTDRTLVVIDNFDVEEDASLAAVVDGPYDLLITTRCDYSHYYPTVKIEPLVSMEHLQDIFLRNYDGCEVSRGDPALTELIELVNRHTYTIELLAQHMERSDQTAEEMVLALKQEGIVSLNEAVRGEDMKSRAAYQNLIKMFRLFSLEQQEQQILMYLSMMPTEGVSVRDFKKWAGLTSASLIKNLGDRSWIVKNTEGIALHPIIKEVVRHELPANEENCGEFLQNVAQSVSDRYAWHFTKAEKDRYALVLRGILEVFGTVTPVTEALYRNAESLFSFAVDPQYAAVLAQQMVDYCKQTYGEAAFPTGRAVFKQGWLYAYNAQMPDSVLLADRYLTAADGILLQLPLTASDDIAALTQTRVNLAKTNLRLFLQTGDSAYYDKALQYAQDTLRRTKEAFLPGDHQYAKVGGAHWQLSDVLIEGGAYEQALEHIDAAVTLLTQMFGQDNADTTGAISRKARVLYGLERYAEAAELAKKGALGYAKFFGLQNTEVCGTLELWGDSCARCGSSEAAEAYSKATEAARLTYAPGAEPLLRIEKKLAQYS